MIFHSYVAVYQRVSSSLLDFENWVYSLVDPKKFPFCNGRSVGRSRALSLSFCPLLSLSRLFHFWEFYLNITCDFLRWLFDGLLSLLPKKVMSCLRRNFLTPSVVEPWLDTNMFSAINQRRIDAQRILSCHLNLVDIKLISQTGHIK